jgi:hypothetical protein
MPAELALAESLLPFAAINGDGAWSPPVDVREHPAQYTVVADLPGRRRRHNAGQSALGRHRECGSAAAARVCASYRTPPQRRG